MLREKNPAIFFVRSARELPGPGRRALFSLWNAAALLLSSAGVTVLSLLLGLGMFDIELFFDYFRHPLIFLLNWTPVLLLQLFLYGLTGRHWRAFLLGSLVVLTASAGGFYKLRNRSEPFVFSDLFILGTALGVAGEFDLTPNVRIWLAIAAVPFGTWILFAVAKGRPARPRRVIYSALALLIAVVLWPAVYSSEKLYTSKATTGSHVNVEHWDEMVFVSKGSVYPFLHSICSSSLYPPDGYRASAAVEILARYEDAEIPEDRRVDLLVFQLESFCDLSRLGLEGLSEDAYALFHAIEAESLCGDLVPNTIGGGTVDAERCFLTGALHLTGFHRDAESFVRYLNRQGYTTLADHPYFGSYYSRASVNRYLGFQTFRCVENHYADLVSALDNPWLSDCFLFPEVLAQYREHAAAGEPVFSFTVTTQGHGGYPDERYDGPPVYWTAPQGFEYMSRALNYYLSCLTDTQVQLSAALESLQAEDRPVVVVVYGDHKPLFGQEALFELVDVSMDRSSGKGFCNYYSTRYLLWANNAARQLLAFDPVGEGPTLSPGFLLPWVFEQLGWKGSAMMQFECEIIEHLSVASENGWYLVDGSWTDALSEEQAALLHRLDMAQYYLTHDFSVSEGALPPPVD